MSNDTGNSVAALFSGKDNSATSVSKPVWEDDDLDDKSRSGHLQATSEPEWVQKRRRMISESVKNVPGDQDATSSTDVASSLTGRLTQTKPRKRGSGMRFMIQRHNISHLNLNMSTGVNQLAFDESNSLFAILGRREKTIRLFNIDKHRSEGNHFGLKSESSCAPTSNRPISSFAFADGGKTIYIVDGHNSVLRYDCEHGAAVRLANITSMRTAYSFRRVHTPPVLDDQNGTVFALSCSDLGGVLLCDSRSSSIAHHFQMNAAAIGVGYHLRAGVVVTADADANIYEWDLVSGRCLHKFHDEHTLQLSCIEMSPTVSAEFASNAYLAVGSRMGFLNRYPVLHSEDSTRSSIIHQSLLKTYGNLSAGITSICHDNKGTFIAYASDQQRNALRIIHNPSGQVVSNWPVETINLGRVTSVAFAPRSSTLAVGNRSGRVQLFGILTC